MNELKETGGARIGMANATWPFATLAVNKDRLELNATIVGRFVFRPADIISIEPVTMMPVFGKGIRIHHRISNYNPKIIFWTFGNPAELIERIQQTGFLDRNATRSYTLDEEILLAQSTGGFPVKTSAAILIVIIWNALLMIDFARLFHENEEGLILGLGTRFALGFIILTCVLLFISGAFRRLILKEGRNINDIKAAILFIMFIAGSMLIINLIHLN